MARARRGPLGRRKYSPVKPLLRPRAAIRWELSAKEGEAGTRRTALTGGAGLTAQLAPCSSISFEPTLWANDGEADARRIMGAEYGEGGRAAGGRAKSGGGGQGDYEGEENKRAGQ